MGRINLRIPSSTLKVFRELGLMLFLIGAGVEGGVELVAQVQASEYGAMLVVYGFIAGVIMTTLPLIVGFLLAKRAFKLQLLNNLGSLTGGMTSTPALGTLVARVRHGRRRRGLRRDLSGRAGAHRAGLQPHRYLHPLSIQITKPPAPTGAGGSLFRWFFRFSRGFCRRRC